MTHQTIAQARALAAGTQRNFRREMADRSMVDQAVKIANLETARSFEPYPEPVDLGWPLWAHVAFWLSVVGMWGIAAYLYWHQMLPPWFVHGGFKG